MNLEDTYPWDKYGNRLSNALSDHKLLEGTFSKTYWEEAIRASLLSLIDRDIVTDIDRREVQKGLPNIAEWAQLVLAKNAGRDTLAIQPPLYASHGANEAARRTRPTTKTIARHLGEWLLKTLKGSLTLEQIAKPRPNDDRQYLDLELFRDWLKNRTLNNLEIKWVASLAAAFAMLQPEISRPIVDVLLQSDSRFAAHVASGDCQVSDLRPVASSVIPQPTSPAPQPVPLAPSAEYSAGSVGAMRGNQRTDETGCPSVREHEVPPTEVTSKGVYMTLDSLELWRVDADKIDEVFRTVVAETEDALQSMKLGVFPPQGLLSNLTHLRHELETLASRLADFAHGVADVEGDDIESTSLQALRQRANKIEKILTHDAERASHRVAARTILDTVLRLQVKGAPIADLANLHNTARELRERLDSPDTARELATGEHPLAWLVSVVSSTELEPDALDVIRGNFGNSIYKAIVNRRLLVSDEVIGMEQGLHSADVGFASELPMPSVAKTVPMPGGTPLAPSIELQPIPPALEFPRQDDSSPPVSRDEPTSQSQSAVSADVGHHDTVVSEQTNGIVPPLGAGPASVKTTAAPEGDAQVIAQSCQHLCKGEYLKAALFQAAHLITGASLPASAPSLDVVVFAQQVWEGGRIVDCPSWMTDSRQASLQSMDSRRLALLTAYRLHQLGDTAIRWRLAELPLLEAFEQIASMHKWMADAWEGMEDIDFWKRIGQHPENRGDPGKQIADYLAEVARAESRGNTHQGAYENRVLHFLVVRPPFRELIALLRRHSWTQRELVAFNQLHQQFQDLHSDGLIDAWIETTGRVSQVTLPDRQRRVIAKACDEFINSSRRALETANTMAKSHETKAGDQKFELIRKCLRELRPAALHEAHSQVWEDAARRITEVVA